jgi:hypothetical protein
VPRLFYASGQNLEGPLNVQAPPDFEVSTAETSGYADNIDLLPNDSTVPTTTVYVRIKATAPAPAEAPATVGGQLEATSPRATTATQFIGGTVFAADGKTQVLASVESLANFSAVRPVASLPRSLFVSGVNLSNNITVSVTSGWQVSTNATNFAGTAITIARNGSTQVPPTPVYVRLAPNQPVGEKSGVATVSSGVASDTVQLAGTVSAPPPFITLAGTFTPFSTTRGEASGAQTCTVSATDLVAPLVMSAPEGYQISSVSSGEAQSRSTASSMWADDRIGQVGCNSMMMS